MSDKPLLWGSDGYVLEAIAESIASGTPAISQVGLSAKSGYTLPTVEAAIRRLERDGYIIVERGGPRRPNHYTLTELGRRAL